MNVRGRGGARRPPSANAAAVNFSSTITSPPASSVPAAKRIGAEWWSGEHTRWRSSAENAHSSASSATRAAAWASVAAPDHTPLGRPVVPDV